MFKGFGKQKPGKAAQEFIKLLHNRLDTYHWLKGKVAGDAEASQLLAQCVMRFSKWELPKGYEDNKDFKMQMGRFFTADNYVNMALKLANQGMPIEQMTHKSIIEAVSNADDEQILALPVG